MRFFAAYILNFNSMSDFENNWQCMCDFSFDLVFNFAVFAHCIIYLGYCVVRDLFRQFDVFKIVVRRYEMKNWG